MRTSTTLHFTLRHSPRHVRTLVLDLDDTLVHSDWTRGRGWRTFKRPGADDFIRQLAQYYELVVFTSQLPTCAWAGSGIRVWHVSEGTTQGQLPNATGRPDDHPISPCAGLDLHLLCTVMHQRQPTASECPAGMRTPSWTAWTPTATSRTGCTATARSTWAGATAAT